MSLNSATNPDYTRLFITRDATNDYETGYYDLGGNRVVVSDRDGLTDIDGSYVGFYADVRAEGVLGNVAIPEPSSALLVTLGCFGFLRRKR
jgi:hypothetical protein